MDDALTRTGTVRGQRRALPTARTFDHMPTAFDHGRTNPNCRTPIHCIGLQRIDAPRVPEVRPLQAHTSFGKDYKRIQGSINLLLMIR